MQKDDFESDEESDAEMLSEDARLSYEDEYTLEGFLEREVEDKGTTIGGLTRIGDMNTEDYTYHELHDCDSPASALK